MPSMLSCATNLCLAAIVVGTPFLAAPAVARGSTRGTQQALERRVWDESRQLSSHERAVLESQLEKADHRVGSPVFLLLVGKLHHETAAAVGAHAFLTRSIASGNGSDPVLLVVSLGDRAAAIETGKGNAGIVPEIDAQRITKDLSTHLSTSRQVKALARAIAAIGESAEATSARRRPLPPDPVPADAPREATVPDSELPDLATDGGPRGDAGTPQIAEKPPASHPSGSGSKLPLAATIAGLLLLALAVRRRRQIASGRREPASGKPKPPAGRR